MGCSTNLCLVMMLWTARAKLSVPPPGPAVAMNSIGFAGCHAACAAPDRPMTRPQVIAANFAFADILVPPIVFFVVLFQALADLVRHNACCDCGHCPFFLKRGNFIGVKTICAQDRGGVLAIERGAGLHL